MFQNILPKNLQEIQIDNPVLNSKQATPGSTFIALNGVGTDGRSFIEDACKKGASIIIYQKSPSWEKKVKLLSQKFPEVTFLSLSEDPLIYLPYLAQKCYPSLPKHIVAVTGTNGKTSTASFSYQILKTFSIPTACLGTNGFESFPSIHEKKHLPSLTTPDIFSLYKILSLCKKEKIDHVFIEASSHGLYQGRLAGLNFSAGCFTNLSPEHLDFHKNQENYFEAKKLLFTKHMLPGSTAVINADDPLSKRIIKTCTSQDIIVKTFGESSNNTLFIESCLPSSKGLKISFVYNDKKYIIYSNFFGKFQAWNLASALLLSTSVTSLTLPDVIKKVSSMNPPKGRMDFLGTTENGATIFIDYAHTPDALEKALLSIRTHTHNKLWVVFGCGGDRDTQKRSLMGKVAERLADTTIITDDNPRTEEPDAIREMIAESCAGAIILEDREQATLYALTSAKEGDSILIAGKGHEEGQIIGIETIPYSDYKTVKKFLAGSSHE